MPESPVSIAKKPAPDEDRIAPVRAVMSEEEGLDFTIIELLFFAYRDFTSDPDQILAEYGFGRAHHRVVHFVNRRPGLTVAELLDVLKITKQSLARVLKQLIDTGHIVQVQGPRDRRQRELYPTAKGRALSLALAAPQSRRIARALEGSGAADRAAVERFLMNMVDPELRAQIGKAPPKAAGDRAAGDKFAGGGGAVGSGTGKGGAGEDRGEG